MFDVNHSAFLDKGVYRTVFFCFELPGRQVFNVRVYVCTLCSFMSHSSLSGLMDFAKFGLHHTMIMDILVVNKTETSEYLRQFRNAP